MHAYDAARASLDQARRYVPAHNAQPDPVDALLSLQLAEAAPVFVAADIAQILVDALHTLPDLRLAPDDALVPAGYAYFDGVQLELAATAPQQPIARFTAVSWRYEPRHEQYQIVAWGAYRCTEHDAPELGPATLDVWQVGEPLRATEQLRPLDPAAPTDEVPVVRQRHTAVRLLLQSLWQFAKQPLAAVEERTPDRAARRQAQRTGQPEPVSTRVVCLRRPEPVRGKAAAGDAESVNWSCSWVQRAHWRQQPYPKAGEVRPKLIRAAVKGPVDLPLRGAERLLAIVR